MGDHEISIKLPGDRHEYLIIEEYNGIKSLVLGNEGKNGVMYKKWGHPQIKDKKIAETAIPWKIPLGNPKQAVEVIRQLAAVFGITGGQSKPIAPEDDSEIPF